MQSAIFLTLHTSKVVKVGFPPAMTQQDATGRRPLHFTANLAESLKVHPFHPSIYVLMRGSVCLQRCKNFEGTRTPLYPLHILDHTVFYFDMPDAESMARQESNRMVGQKAATPSQSTDPLIHKMGFSMALSQSRKAASSIAPTEWFFSLVEHNF